MKLGFIGLGKMGKPMVLNLMKHGHTLTVYNRSQFVVNELAALGARPGLSPAEVGANSDVVFTNLPIGKDVELIVSGENGLLSTLQPGSMIIDHSTISPSDAVKICESCKANGVGFLDAPVSGGVVGAEQATLSIMVGGAHDIYEKALPLLNLVGKNISYLGPSGSGSVMKLVNNLMVGITNAALAEAFVLAVKKGLDPEQVFNILSKSSGDSAMLKRNLPNFVLNRNFSPSFTLDMLNKDIGLAQDLASSEGVRLLLGSLAYQIGKEASYTGLGNEDMSAVIKVLEKLTDLEVKKSNG